jgi:hypothetical protein
MTAGVPSDGGSSDLTSAASADDTLGAVGLRALAPISSRPSEPQRPTMTKPVPDRLSADPKSRFHDAELLEQGVGIRFNGVERHDVHEYCLSEGWIKVPVGRTLDRRGQPMCFTLRGKVEAWVKGDDAGVEGSPEPGPT